MKSVVLVLFIASCCFPASAQDPCRSTLYKEELIRQNPEVNAKISSIEAFTQNWIAQQKVSVNDLQGSGKNLTVITIPVIVHIVYHAGAQNISDAQIQSQLDVLNRDYRRLNPDTVKTPQVFHDFAANCGFEFVLAKADPQGNPITGIIRKHTDVYSFTIDDRIKFSATGGDDAWDPDGYLNIWVANLTSGLLGYASVPGVGKDKDGVVISYSAFGTMGSAAAPFNGGRTVTHEIGHWLNLIHTWGDADCGSDYVDDTPPQKGPNRGCPGAMRITCGGGPYGDMFMNYMDFTDDACMNMFTNGQKDRMHSLFAPGGPRSALLNSVAATAVSGSTAVQTLTTHEINGGLLRVYPNPASDMVSLQITDSLSSPIVFGIYNSTGQRVITVRVTQPLQQINVAALHSGIYYIKSENEKSNKVTRLVKM
jgi:hypothetical protein